jgi:hypothetical protein
VTRTASKAARGLGLVGRIRSKPSRSSSMGGELPARHSTASGGLDSYSPGSLDTGGSAVAAVGEEAKDQVAQQPSATAAAGEGRLAATCIGDGDAGMGGNASSSSSMRWGSGSVHAVHAAKVNKDVSSAAEQERAAEDDDAVAVVKESAEGEVRLVVAPTAALCVSSPAVSPASAAATAQAGTSPVKHQQQPQQQQDEARGLALQSAESLTLTEAAAAAALAAAALAQSEAAAGPPQHRVGPLRFMVQPSSRHVSNFEALQLQQDAAAAAAVPNVLAFAAVQQQGGAAGAAGAAGMSQVVQDLFAAQGRTGPGGDSSTRAGAAAGAAAAAEESVGQPPRTRWVWLM